MKKISFVSIMVVAFLMTVQVMAQDAVVDFESERWVLQKAKITQHLDRKSLMGSAYLKDVEFENGIIEVDIAVSNERSYPGFMFRIQSEGNYESFYIRPHRSKFYTDTLQYTPVMNGISSWQLYNGDGYTAGAIIPMDTWFHLKLEVSGKKARIFINNAEQPALVIPELKHGVSKGTIGLNGPVDGTAYFSNFSYALDDAISFDTLPPAEKVVGIITDWELSQSYKISAIDLNRSSEQQGLNGIVWQKALVEDSGLVNIARHTGRTGGEPDCVWARTTITSDKEQVRPLNFGYSDLVSIFLNGEILFSGSSAYRLRDPSFLGIVGFFDSVFLPLKEGENELLLLVVESFGGWGFMCQYADATYQDESLSKQWETAKAFKMPESVAYDPKRKVFFVTNYDGYNYNPAGSNQFISRVSADGTIEALQWVGGLSNPTGAIVVKDILYVVEPRALVAIDIQSAKISKRYPIPGAVFPNDVTADKKGNIYISDSRKSAIYKFSKDTFEEWLAVDKIMRPNGIYAYNNQLLILNMGDNSLISVQLDTKEARKIASLGKGTPDGLKVDAKGNYLVSLNEGKLYRITPSGELTKLLDTTVTNVKCADFEYVPDNGDVVIPTFDDNRIIMYQVSPHSPE